MQYLVATDGSEASVTAVRHAATQAVERGAALEIVNVLEPEPELIDGEIVLPGGAKATERGEQTVANARRVATDTAEGRAGDPAVTTRLLTGRPADAITDHAEETGADAIFVGHRGRSADRAQAVGSVAKSVIDKATVPVTVIR